MSWFSLIVVIQIIFQWSVSGVFLIRSLPLVTEIVLAIPTGGKGHRIAAHGIYGQFLDIKATSTFTSNLVQ